MSKKVPFSETTVDLMVDRVIAESDRIEKCLNRKDAGAYHNALDALREAFATIARLQNRPSWFIRSIRNGRRDDSLLAMVAE